MSASLRNFANGYNGSRDRDIEHQFDRSVSTESLPPLSWEQASRGLLYIAQANGPSSGDTIKTPVAGRVVKSLHHYDSRRGALRTVRPLDLARWNVSRYEAESIAEDNMAVLLCGRNLLMRESGPVRFAMLDCPGMPSPAALCLTNYFRMFMKSVLGLPVYVALPTRNSLFIFPVSSRSDIAFLRQDLLKDYQSGGQPVTSEVLEIAETGIRVYKDLADWQ